MTTPVIDNDMTKLDVSGQNGMLVQALQATVDKRVGQYITVRDRIKEMKERHDKELAPLTEVQNLLSGWLDDFMQKSGSTGVKTMHGTCYTSTRYTASLADPDAFMKYVITNSAFDLLDRRANSNAVKDFVKDHNGNLPPGCNLGAIRTVGVRRPGKKSDPE